MTAKRHHTTPTRGRVARARSKPLTALFLTVVCAFASGCAHLVETKDARIEVVDEAVARKVLTDAGYVVTDVDERVITAEEGRALLTELGVEFLASDSANGHATMKIVNAESEAGTATITLVTSTKPCWADEDETSMDRMTGQARWTKTVHEVDTWCFSTATVDIDRDCAVDLMKLVVAASR